MQPGKVSRMSDKAMAAATHTTGVKGQHQPDHDTSKVARKDGVDDDEDMLILELLEAHVYTGWEKPDQEVEVEEESWPGSRLMLGHGGNDGNMDLGISGIPERVETTTPGSNDTRNRRAEPDR